jgi:hypothetical protein
MLTGGLGWFAGVLWELTSVPYVSAIGLALLVYIGVGALERRLVA